MNVGENIKKLRKDMKISQVELADKIGISHTTVQNYESNRFTPTLDIAVKIADILGVDLNYLVYHKVND